MKRSKFSLSNYKLLTCDMGELVPCGIFEVLPGDTIQHNTSMLIRCSPMLAPVMHPVQVRVHHWFVPHRLVWDNWEKFITGGPDGMNDSVFPTIQFSGGSGAAVGSLADYLGVPPGVNDIVASALPFRAYAMIYNQFYRDQDLNSESAISLADGPDSTTSTLLSSCMWEKDYFTSARPWEQKGPAVTIPLGTSAPVVSDGSPPWFTNNTSNAKLQMQSGNAAVSWSSTPGATGDARFGQSADLTLTGLETDLSGASAVTVNVLREALALQRFEEARARYGSRYTEYLRYLGVRSSDARLQRPEYLGGGRQTLQFSEVLQTADNVVADDVETATGTMRGHGIGAVRSNRYRRFMEEHGYVISLLSVRPKTIYAQGLARHFNRRSKEDFWQKELEHIGQQPVLKKEVYAASAAGDEEFGFQDRYDEYRRTESTIAAEFRTSLLDYWHFARIFSSEPSLNGLFTRCVPTDKPFAVPSQDVLYVMANHSIQARRMVSKTGSSFIF